MCVYYLSSGFVQDKNRLTRAGEFQIEKALLPIRPQGPLANTREEKQQHPLEQNKKTNKGSQFISDGRVHNILCVCVGTDG